MDGTWRLGSALAFGALRDETECSLECNNDMALGRDRVCLFSICSEVVVPPEDFWLGAAGRKGRV